MENEKFGSKIGIIAATAGSAVGLGNLWGFSYKAGTNGGGFFVLIYLLFVVSLGVPLMLSEFMIGKNGKSDAITSFENLDKKGSFFTSAGFTGILASFLVLTFYGVLAGWSLIYFIEGITTGFSAYTSEASETIFNETIMSAKLTVTAQLGFMALVIGVLLGGVQSGIEKMSKILMPMLFVIIIGLALYGLTLPGSKDAYAFFFKPTFEGVEAGVFEIATAAMAQAFFSLSLGMAVIITYGSYVDSKLDIVSITKQVAVADTAVALLAGLAIFPIVFSAGIDPSGGPGLMFISLPIGFGSMAGGRFIGIVFFLLVVIAALTSAISLLENTVSLLKNRFGMDRVKATILSGVVASIIGLGANYTFGFGLPFLNWTGSTDFLDQLDLLTMNLLIPLSALLVTLFVGYRLKFEYILKEFGNNETNAKNFLTYVKVVMPILIGVVLLSSILSFF